MNRGRVAGGYTIIEVLIVLAVTSLMAISAWGVISGQQRRTEYNTASRDIELRVQDIMNDVATGYYSRTVNFSCKNQGGEVFIDGSVGADQGSNTDCIFLGRAIQFAANGDGSGYRVYDIVGLRKNGTKFVESLAQAKPRALPEPVETGTLPGGFQVKSAGTTAYTIAFMSTLAEYDGAGGSNDIVSGTQTVQTFVVPNGSQDQSITDVMDNILLLKSASPNPSGGVKVCMEGGLASQHIILSIGASQDSSATNMQFNTGGGCA